MATSLIQKAKNFIFGDQSNANHGVHDAEIGVITDATVKEKVRELAGITEGDATHLFPLWNNTTKKFDMKTAGEIKSAIG